MAGLNKGKVGDFQIRMLGKNQVFYKRQIGVLFLFFGILLVLVSCTGINNNAKARAIGSVAVPLTDPVKGSSSAIGEIATATPFLPQEGLGSEESDANKSSRPWGNYAGPTIWPPIDIPSPAGILPQPQDQINIVLLGDDRLEGETIFRTDAIMLLILKPSQGTASLVSFPRDLFVYIPGWTMQRINFAMWRGGFDMFATMFEYNFGIRPKYYVKINMLSMKTIIDDLGGVDVNVTEPIYDPYVPWATPLSVKPGLVHMSGEEVFMYTKARYSTSDFDRERRHQEVLNAIFMRLLSMDVFSRIPELYSKYQKEMEMNLKVEDIIRWISLANQLKDTNRIWRFRIGEDMVTSWKVPTTGDDALLPKREAILGVIKEAIQK